jgi:perosamine synthetase
MLAHRGGDNVIVTLSVRSALDLYLQVQKFPRGSQVLMSAINIPDMSVVLRHHGLIPVPVDVDPHTFAPNLALAEQLITPQTVAICVAHVFGRRMDISPILQWCAKHKLQVCISILCFFLLPFLF